MSPPFKKCDVCGGKVPVQDPHTSCLLCLGRGHDAKACPLCKSMSSQARKNRESRLTSAIAQGKIREGDFRPSSAPSTSTAAPALPSRDGPPSAPPSTSSALASKEPSSSSKVARGSAQPSATSKPTKHPQKSGSVGTAAASTSTRDETAPSVSDHASRKAAPTLTRDETAPSVSDHASRKAAPSVSSSAKGSKDAPRPTKEQPKSSKGDGSDARRSASDKTGEARPAARISESPIPFFPPDAPREAKSAKKRRASVSTGSAATPKKARLHSKASSKSSVAPKEVDASKGVVASREADRRDRPRSLRGSPTTATVLPSLPDERRPSEGRHDQPAGGEPSSAHGLSAAATVPFLLSDDDEPHDLRVRSPSPAPHSPTGDQDDPAYFYDSETDQFYLPVPREVAMLKSSGRDRTWDRDRYRQEAHTGRAGPSKTPSLPPASRPTQHIGTEAEMGALSSGSEPDPVESENLSNEDDPLRESPQDLHHPEAPSPTDDVRSFGEHVIKMSRALGIELAYPEEEAKDPVERRVHGRVHIPPSIPFLPSLETLVKRSWDAPSSLLGPPRKIESLYRVSAPNSPWLTSHPRQNSAIVEGAQQTSTQRQATSPMDKEAKKVDALARKAYAAAALAVKATNYTACMGAYVQTLMEGISPVLPEVSDEAQRTLSEIRDEAHSIGSWLITAARNVAECSGRAMAASIALRRHAWLRGSDLNSSVRGTIEEMPIDDSGLFHAETDEKLNKKFRMKAAARKHGMSAPVPFPFRRRSRPWQQQQGQFQRSSYQDRQFHQQGIPRQRYPSHSSSSSGRRGQPPRYRKNRRQYPDQAKKRA